MRFNFAWRPWIWAVLPLNATWLQMERSTGDCYYQRQAIACGERVQTTPSPFTRSPKSMDGVVLAWIEAPLQPELSALKDSMNPPDYLWVWKSDQNVTLPPPQNLRVENLIWSNPYLIVQTPAQVWWIDPFKPQAKWSMRFGQYVHHEGSTVVLLGTENQIRVAKMDSNQDTWSSPLPVLDVQHVTFRKSTPPLWGFQLKSTQHQNDELAEIYWLHSTLGVWVHSTETTKLFSESMGITATPCPTHPQLPQYGSVKKNADTFLCLDHVTLNWVERKVTETQSSPNDDQVVSFWNQWLTQIGGVKGLSIRRNQNGQLRIRGFLESKSDLDRVSWYLRSVCETPHCGADLELKKLPNSGEASFKF